jgi:hypothetical protein
MMSKKDFEHAAVIVQRVHAQSGAKCAAVVCAAFVILFKGDNPRFDVSRFEKACGV